MYAFLMNTNMTKAPPLPITKNHMFTIVTSAPYILIYTPIVAKNNTLTLEITVNSRILLEELGTWRGLINR